MASEYSMINDRFTCEYSTRKACWSMYNLHYHKSYEVFIMTSGSTSILSSERIIEAKRGDVMLFPKNSLHKNMGGTTHSRYVVNFSDEFLNSHFVSAASLLQCFEHPKLTLTDSALDLACGIMDAMLRLRNEYAYLAALLALLNDPGQLVSEQPRCKNESLDPVLEYINRNYKDISCLDEIATAVHTSKSYLCQLFSKNIGITVTDYLNSVRIKNACRLLSEKHHNITETALLCGYSSPAYFCRVFKRIVHMTPNEYRRYAAPRQ